jgi:amino acid transporter
MFAFCYAELGRAHNSAGGEYVYAKRVFGGMAGYATFLTVLVMLLFIPPVLATGAATYLNNALGTKFDSQTVALVIVVAVTPWASSISSSTPGSPAPAYCWKWRHCW